MNVMLDTAQPHPASAEQPKAEMDLARLANARDGERFALHSRFLNDQMVRVLQTIGYDVGFVRGEGAYLYDRKGDKYLDLLSGFGVFALGRNHPAIKRALVSVIEADLPNLVQLDVSTLAGVLAEKLIKRAPYLEKAFFANSGAEAVEGAMKFARGATGRAGIVFCEHAYHGLTYGALSMNGEPLFQNGFGPYLPHISAVPFNDLNALEARLRAKDVAAFFVEPIQGKGVNMPDDRYLKDAAELCRKYGTLFVADEVQTGLGRTGKFFAVEHWGVEPDMILIAKALSGGHVPVGAILARKWIFDKVFNRMDRAVVHGSTFSKNDLAMAAGIATLDVLDAENLVENSARQGQALIESLQALIPNYELLKEVRGKGMMIGVEFGAPKSLKLRAAWTMLETVNKGLFCQMITIPLFKDHKILSQVAGHANPTIKLLPPLVIDAADRQWIVKAFDQVIGEAHQVPGAVWSLGKTLADHALKARAAR